jgi:Ca2+-binding RTX toxin-like protein
MDKTILARKGALVGGTALLAAVLAALLLLSVAKPSGAQDVPLVSVDPTSVDFGSLDVSADPETRQITVTNNGLVAITIGDVAILGADAAAFDLQTDLGLSGLTIGVGESKVLDLSFDPVTTGLQSAQLTLKDLAGNAIAGAPTVSLTGQGVGTNPAGSGCTITGSNISETLRGTPQKDVICGLGGADRINGLGSGDVLRGGRGNDRITDKAGKDKLLGQAGRDRLNARDGSRGDLLKGGPGKDRAIMDRGDRARSI